LRIRTQQSWNPFHREPLTRCGRPRPPKLTARSRWRGIGTISGISTQRGRRAGWAITLSVTLPWDE
jgi:hypothetical protein